MSKLKTHFEQIPISAVRKIAKEVDGENRDIERDDLIVEHSRQKKMEPYAVRTNSHAGD